MSATAALALSTFPDYFANAITPPEPAGAYVWWRFGDVRPDVETVEAALNAFAAEAGIPWQIGDKVEIAPASAMRAAASGFKYNLPNATVEAKVVYDDGNEGKVCLLRKRLVGSAKGATLEGETVCEIYIGLHNLNVKPVIVAKDSAFGEDSAPVGAFLRDLHRERTTVGYLTVRPDYLIPALRSAQAIGQKSRAGFYWVAERSASKINALAAFMTAIGSALHVVRLRKDEGTVGALQEGTRLHLSDLISELEANVSKLKDQADRGRTPRADSMAAAQALILEIRETGELVREVLDLRMDDVLQALDTAERQFKALSEGKGSKAPVVDPAPVATDADATDAAPTPKRRGRPAKNAAQPTPATQAQEPALVAEPAVEPESAEPSPTQDFTQSEPAQIYLPSEANPFVVVDALASALKPAPEPEQTAAKEQAPEPAPEPVILPEPVTTPEPTEDEGIKWPTDEAVRKMSRESLRIFCKDARVKALYEARGVKGIMSFNPDQLRNLIVALRDGDAE